MEDNAVVAYHHQEEKISRRTNVLTYLRNTIRENGDFVHFSSKLTLFKELYHILGDEMWEVRYECLQLITDLIPVCGIDLDPCMETVLPRIIRNMGHPKNNVRRASIQTLHTYMKHTTNVQKVLQAIVFYGLESEDDGPNQACTVLSLPMLLTPEFDKENYLILVEALARQLVVGEEDRKQAAFFSLQKVRQLVGLERFDKYLKNLHPKIMQEYKQMVHVENNNLEESLTSQSETDDGKAGSEKELMFELEALEFGIVPQSTMKKLTDDDNWDARCQGTESLKHIVMSLNDVSPLIPHIVSFLSLLNHLITDVNFKVTSITLDIYRILIDKVKYRIRPHLHMVVNALSRQLADSKIVVRSGCIKALMQLMQCVSPMPTITILNGNLQNKNTRLKEETINLFTAALLTFPSYEFELLTLCNMVAPMIMDPKRRIRQAVLECLAVLSQELGPTRSSKLLEIVENVQRQHQADRIVAVVQARLARRILPRVTADGLVEYSIHVPNSAGRRAVPFAPQGADVDWILSGSGSLSSGSASARADSDRGLSSGTTRSSQSGSFPSSPAAGRRIVSPGRSKNRLPWEGNGTSNFNHHGRNNQRIRTFSDDNVCVQNKSSPEKDDLYSRSSISIENFPIEYKGSNQQATSKNTQKQVYLQRLRHNTEKNGDKVQLTKMGMTILPDKPMLEDKRNHMKVHVKNSHHQDDVNLSNTWPQAPTSLRVQTRKRVLDPINGMHDGKSRHSPEMPVPTRPTIVRSSSANRLRKIPPISNPSLSSDAHELWKPLQESFYSTSQDSFETIEDPLDDFQSYGNVESRSTSSTDVEHCHRSSVVHSPENDSGVSVHVYQRPIVKDSRSPMFEEIPFNSKPVLVRSPSLSRIKTSGSAISNNNSILNSSFSRPTSQSDDEIINIVGKGMILRDSANSMRNGTPIQSPPHSKMKNNFEDVGIAYNLEPLPLVQGVGMTHGSSQVLTIDENDKQSEPDHFSSDYHSIEEGTTSGDEDQYAMSMSQSTRDRLLFKKQEMMREAEKRIAENQNRLKEKHIQQPESLDDESDESGDDDGEDNEAEAQSYVSHPPSRLEVAKPKPPPDKPPYTRKVNLTSSSPGSKQMLKSVDSNDEKPFRNPETALQDAIKSLNSSEWTTKCEGTKIILRLTNHNPDVLINELHDVVLLLLREVKNLRSSVSRAAIGCVGMLFKHLKKHMETDLDNICKVLLHKSGESNKFIQEDVEKALSHMAENLTPLRVGAALIAGGASHKNALVRKLTAQLVLDVAEKFGPYKLLSGTKDITDKILPAAAQFVMDSSPYTRYYGRSIFYLVMSQPNFDSALQRYIPANTLRNIKNILDGIRVKGIGDKPSNSPPGRFRKSDNLNKTM